jgi:putative SOS response-associated peptidase YedK
MSPRSVIAGTPSKAGCPDPTVPEVSARRDPNNDPKEEAQVHGETLLRVRGGVLVTIAAMCGRFSQSESSRRLAQIFDAKLAADLPDGSHNVAPTATIRVVLERDGKRWLAPASWGFRPAWTSRHGTPVPSWINAKAETAAESRAFGPALRTRRCIVPVDAFYEWDRRTTPKQPYAIGSTDGSGPLALAGIWSPPGDDRLPSVAILTTAPNDLMRTIHHRMPVVVPAGVTDDWLAPAADVGTLLGMLSSVDDTALRMWPVSPAVNRASTDGPGLLESVDPPATLGLIS